MRLVWFIRNDGNLYANSSAGLYCIQLDHEQGVYVLSLGGRHLFQSASLEEARSWAEEFVDALRAAKRRLRELLRLKAATQQKRRARTRRPNDEALADEYLNYDPDTEAMLGAFSRRIDEVRVEETTD